MPIIIISGLPASGKTTRAKELQTYFQTKNKVYMITENEAIPKAGFHKNEYFSDSQKEKLVRSDLKSEVIRLLNNEDVIILDASNYIKGYRYELFCATKAACGTQCTLFCGIQKDKAWQFNVQRKCTAEKTNVDSSTMLNNSDIQYTREIFDALCMRYEEPNSNCRWDSPLFVCFPGEQLDFKAIYSALYESQPLPANKSTQNPPLSSANYLFDLDRLTQDTVVELFAARKIGILGPVPVKNSQTKIDIPCNINAIQLNRLRRQFLNYSKLHHGTSSLERVPQLFVQFLNSNCKS